MSATCVTLYHATCIQPTTPLNALLSKLPNSLTKYIDQITLSLTMRITGPFTWQIPLLIGLEILTIVAFILSILALCGGTSKNPPLQSAILTVQLSQVTYYT
jgi:hypothetical protein